MNQIHVEASLVIDARPEDIYAVIADYRVGHPAILPKPYFSDLTIEQGGIGAGTIIRFTMTVFGQTYSYHQMITEPEPGRVLLETDLETGQFSMFTIESLNEGKQARVRITSAMPASPGLKGLIERLTTPFISSRLFKKELQNLAGYLRQQDVSAFASL